MKPAPLAFRADGSVLGMRLARGASVLFLALGVASFAQAQDSPRTQRTGIVKGPTSAIRIQNRHEINDLGVMPTGYTYTLRGQEDAGGDVQVSEVELTSADGTRSIRMTRFDATARVAAVGGGLVVGVGSSARRLLPNPNRGLRAELRKAARDQAAGGYYWLRGWAIDTQEQARVERTLLLDAIFAASTRRGPGEWVKAIYTGPTARLVVEEGGARGGADRSRDYTPRQFKPLQSATPGLPAFARARDPIVRAGVVRVPRSKVRIENRYELNQHDLVPIGYAYVLTGREERLGFEVDRVELTSPDGTRAIRMTRYDSVAEVRGSSSEGLVAQAGDQARALLKNPNLGLDSELAADAREHAAPGNYRLRGWAIDVEDAGSVRQVLLLDGVRAQLEPRGDPLWIGAVYRAYDRVVIDDGKQVTSAPFKEKRLRFMRGEAPRDHRGMTSALPAGHSE